ncbi:hypothetical protein [Natrarchaeobius oligotrophus]|uniref:hypothetical protein n=1 Tax=Natrarchaeobius oligotrophus TaxID=3455743 RepID=UPI0014055B33|nr:hypothetical protein [Natrarchaeobius chitinivorans]
MGAPDRKQVVVRVSPSQRDDWDEYADELGFSSRGEMIRRSVEFFHSKQTDDSDQSSEDLESRLVDMQDDLESLRLDVQDVRREQIGKTDIDDVADELEHRVTQYLSRGPGGSEPTNLVSGATRFSDDDDFDGNGGGSGE